MRKLATIRKVSEIVPIEKADKIELARIDGWQCVVKINEFHPDDLGVYFEIDSFLPASDQRYSFLEKEFRNDTDGNRGARLRTKKLRGVLSQGLLMPLSLFPEISSSKEGDDVTEMLNILKYEPPIPAQLAGTIKGLFPSFIPKTDQERIQNLPNLVSDEDDYEITIKLDGSSMTAYHYNGEFGVCSRNLDLKEDDTNSFWKIANQYLLKEYLPLMGNFAIQGELIGEGIQKNPEKLSGRDFYLFDVWNIDTRKQLNPVERVSFLETLKQLGCEIKMVPVLDIQSPKSLGGTMEALLSYAEGPSLNNDNREGLVFKKLSDGSSFKVISNKYLLSGGE